MECELCGKELKKVHKAKVEGSILSVCDSCLRYGAEVQFSPALQETEASEKKPSLARRIMLPRTQEIPEFELVEDYSALIRKAREQRNMKQDEFAKFLNERESVIKKLETGKAVPDFELIKKLEKKLNIRISEQA